MRISDWSSDVCSSDLAHRIDHDYPPAACTQFAHRAHHIAMGEYAAFRGGRIAAEDDEQIGPVDIGNGNFPFIAEHQHGGKILGMLVDRARSIEARESTRLKYINERATRLQGSE